jgi:signal transduction histidine kinase
VTGVHFSVDSRLLRELGDRLVGRPHIALAELIKNSYDADATVVEIEFTGTEIVITDNGHGMTREDFVSRWMRIGSTHKEDELVSPGLERPLTGSKGVGRLAVQLLADRLELRSRVASNAASEIVATVDWREAVEAGLLTTATADVRRVKIPLKNRAPSTKDLGNAPANSSGEVPGLSRRASGVQLVLSELNQTWDRKAFKQLAEEIWPLQPPFRAEGEGDFRVVLKSPDEDLVEEFDTQMTAVLQLWSARIVGRLLPVGATVDETVYEIANPDRTTPVDRAPARIVELNVEFVGDDPWTIYYRLPDCHIDRVKFEVRVYNLRNRQPHNITVGDARRYLNSYGGVHVYDANFHLPYYGPESDWLGIEMDHSHRRSTSEYLPEGLTVVGGGEHLPTNSRLYGTVEVSTAHEGVWARKQAAKRPKKAGPGDGTAMGRFPAREGLRIQVTRDRLVDTVAYRNLASLVRAAVDVYAMEQARRAFELVTRERDTITPAPEQARDLAEALEQYRPDIPEPIYKDLKRRVAETATAIRVETRARTAQVGLLAPLATAGVSALAYEHEVGKQFLSLEQIAGSLRDGGSERSTLAAESIEQWLDQARATRALFTPILNRGNRQKRTRLKAKSVVRGVIEQVEGLARGAELTNHVEIGLRLPNGTFTEWSALLQNLLINAMNATLDSETRRIDVSSSRDHERVSLRVQDTGYGIDLKKAPKLFRPFERDSKVSEDRAELGLGGTGLGLTIVAMLADELGCTVEFEPPADGFSTCATISWEEDE